MPPAENSTPDFDSMTPEELMAWMETLAKRQGADEGFTTSANVQIAEIDPSTVQDTGPGYIPYGMTQEQWEKKQAEEAAKKAARQASAPPAPTPVAAPPPPAPVPVPAAPAPAAAAPASSEMPDFDKMTPEELMAWMETLAERQGASEGFTTTTRVQIAEVDPTVVKDTGPGYIPYGMTQEQWEKKQAEEAAKKAARQPAAPPPAAPARPAAAAPAPPPVMPPTPTFDLPQLPTEPGLYEATTEVTPAMGGLDWLESLASPSSGSLPQIDLSGLGTELPTLDLDALASPLNLGDLGFLGDTPAQAAPAAAEANPLDWLQGLSQTESPAFPIPTTAPEPPAAARPPERFTSPVAEPAEGDTLEWLESLAKRQGVNEEELATRASLDIPLPQAPAQQPGYSGYTFEQETFGTGDAFPLDLDAVEATEAGDALSWLDELANSQSAQASVDPLAIIEEAKSDRVMQALSSGKSLSPDEIKGWMDNMMDKGMVLSDDTGFVVDEEAPVEDQLEAQIPDWLLDQVGPPPVELNLSTPRAPEPSAFSAPVSQPEAVDLPEWLQDSPVQEDSFDAIFATSDEDQATRPLPTLAQAAPPAPAPAASSEIEVDVNDPWVEAFELERQTEASDEIPTWYSSRLNQLHGGEGEDAPVMSLQQAVLPAESELPEGQPESVPDWLLDDALIVTAAPPPPLAVVAPAVPAEVLSFLEEDESDEISADMPDWLLEQIPDELSTISDNDMPDWLKEAGVEKTDTVPDWLIDTITVEVELPRPEMQATLAPQVVVTQPMMPVVAASPAPVPAAARQIDIGSALQSARGKLSGGDLAGALIDYELVVRANAGLDAVVGDLGSLVKQEAYKTNAGVYRVLGDGLMRLGRLQEALDTYRKALNLL